MANVAEPFIVSWKEGRANSKFLKVLQRVFAKNERDVRLNHKR